MTTTEYELQDFTVTRSEKPRHARQLPTLHFVVVDDWMEKLSEPSFCLYLKLWTMVNRKLENPKIQSSQGKMADRLGVSKPTLLKHLKPLYEYGLIELQEYEESQQKGSKPINIVVHAFPQNNPDLAIRPIEKVRDWKTRTKVKYSFTEKGGRPYPAKVKEAVENVTHAPAEPIIEPTVEVEPEPAEQTVEELTLAPEILEKFTPEVMEKLHRNKVDLEVLFKWLADNQEKVAEHDVTLVIEQLCSYLEPVKTTAGAILYIMSNKDKIRKSLIALELSKITEQPREKHYQYNNNSSKVPFYNWLEERE